MTYDYLIANATSMLICILLVLDLTQFE